MRWYFLGPFALLSAVPARAGDLAGVPLTRFELVDVYRLCSIRFRPGRAMVPCIIDQATRIAREKQIEQSARQMEAVTKPELR